MSEQPTSDHMRRELQASIADDLDADITEKYWLALDARCKAGDLPGEWMDGLQIEYVKRTAEIRATLEAKLAEETDIATARHDENSALEAENEQLRVRLDGVDRPVVEDLRRMAATAMRRPLSIHSDEVALLESAADQLRVLRNYRDEAQAKLAEVERERDSEGKRLCGIIDRLEDECDRLRAVVDAARTCTDCTDCVGSESKSAWDALIDAIETLDTE